MKKDFIYWLRWIAVLPGALIAGFLMTFPLHWILYFSLAQGRVISGVNIAPIERALTPFVIAITFILVGFEIAPEYKFRTSITLTILYMIGIVSLMIYMSKYQSYLEPRGYLGILGSFLGLYIAWRKSRITPLTEASEVSEITEVPEVKGVDRMTCFDCKHFIDNINFTCKAFPKGIPRDIILDEIKHNHRIEGQTSDYVFEPEE